MNQWSFVLAAYGVTVAASGGLVLWGLASMRAAEAAADALKRRD